MYIIVCESGKHYIEDSWWTNHGRFWTLDTSNGYVAIVWSTTYIIYDSETVKGDCNGVEDGKKQVDEYFEVGI
jgi:hypothetical protein